ncbi:MAG: TlpA family protein disulfide reductase [Acidobacteria bacterium]|nr:TlpA family protein disulfide reductase [Acidobacteriota bacterium]
MPRLTKASPLRVVLLLVLGMVVLDFVWVQTHPDAGRRRPSRFFGMQVGGEACPDTGALRRTPGGQQESLGENEYGWKLTALDGRETTLEEHRGKVVFVNVWATWCGPCVAEMRGIQSLYDSAQKDGVAFVLVSEEKPEIVKTFVEKEKYTFPVFTTQNIPDKFETKGIPATFIVTRQGAIAHKQVGSANWNTDSCRKLLQALQ